MSINEAIQHLKAANERNNADMLNYLDRRAFEGRDWFKGSPFPTTDLAEKAYQKAKTLTFDEWKSEVANEPHC